VAWSNNLSITFIFETFQLLMFLLNEEATLNIYAILERLSVSQVPISWLKAVAIINIPDILATFFTFQSPIGWLNFVALLNIPDTLAVFQILIESLPAKFAVSSKAAYISCTPVKIGASEAVKRIFFIPWKALLKLDHLMPPHCLISWSLSFSLALRSGA